MTPSRTRCWRAGRPVDVPATLGTLRHGRADPAFRILPGGEVWWATQTPAGVGTLRLRESERSEVAATAWGPGADWLLDRVPDLLGAQDVLDGFDSAGHPVVAAAWRRHPGWRVPRTARVFEAVAAAVVEQKVTGAEAAQGWRRLLTRFGTSAPGPTPGPMWAPPAPLDWRSVPSWEYQRAGVTPQRARTLVAVASVAARLERMVDLEPAAARELLQAVPGVGEWTAAEAAQRALGDADAVSFGDFHLAKDLCFVLAGERGDDRRLRGLLEPWCGHRYRVQRLVELGAGPGIPRGAPRRGPRFAPPRHRAG